MDWLMIGGVVIGGLGLIFGGVVLFGAPFLPTFDKQARVALDLLDLKPGQTLLELGCGDGRVLKLAAERGWSAVGYELNPLLALVAWVRNFRYRHRVRIVCGNYWRKDWPEAQGIYVFLLDRYMKKLDKKIIQTYGSSGRQRLRVASFAFRVPGRKPTREEAGIFLYQY